MHQNGGLFILISESHCYCVAPWEHPRCFCIFLFSYWCLTWWRSMKLVNGWEVYFAKLANKVIWRWVWQKKIFWNVNFSFVFATITSEKYRHPGVQNLNYLATRNRFYALHWVSFRNKCLSCEYVSPLSPVHTRNIVCYVPFLIILSNASNEGCSF